MKKDRLKDKFLVELEKTPIVQHVCERLGVTRNTYYRWIKEDSYFSFGAKEALDCGISYVNDHAESVLLSMIKQGKLEAVKYWLSSRHYAYRRPLIVNTINNSIETREEREQKIQEGMEKLRRFQNKWFKDPKKEIEKKAQESLEEWKKNGGEKK